MPESNEPLDEMSAQMLESAIAAIGEGYRGPIMSIYRLGFVDGQLSANKVAAAMLRDAVTKATAADVNERAE